MPTLPDLKASAGAIGRGTLLGSLLGHFCLGGVAIIASFAATRSRSASQAS